MRRIGRKFSFRKRYQRYRRKRAGRAATKIQRAWRKRKSPASRLEKTTIETCKTFGTFFETERLFTIQELKHVVIEFPQWAMNNNLGLNGRRSSENIFVKGIAIDMLFTSQLQRPVTLHLAILQPKANPFYVEDFNKGFFRDDVNAGTKERDFQNSISAWEPCMEFYKINPDRFNILKHSKYLLDPYNTDPQVPADQVVLYNQGQGTTQGYHIGQTTTRSAKFFKRIKMYLKINKTFNFQSGGADQPEFPIYITWWASCFGTDDVERIGNSGFAKYTYMTRVYFKDL